MCRYVRQLLLPVAAALRLLHSVHLVHGCLSPENVLLFGTSPHSSGSNTARVVLAGCEGCVHAGSSAGWRHSDLSPLLTARELLSSHEGRAAPAQDWWVGGW